MMQFLRNSRMVISRKSENAEILNSNATEKIEPISHVDNRDKVSHLFREKMIKFGFLLPQKDIVGEVHTQNIDQGSNFRINASHWG
jgi:hypothetical protein